ncbi:MAG: glycosyltransferase family 2 protein [Acetobacteraceae bacterium]|nr:glycosyltransferase family 2 protein [Acetobacteraceae bacterium]
MSAGPLPEVTVVVPAYNAAGTIDETLRSVRAQTLRELEILVVDDGSQDGTPEIVLRHAAVDPRVRLIRQSNAGVAAARNRGIQEARAEFVAPVDADDLWHVRKIERQMQAIRAGGPEVALVYTWFAPIDENGRIISMHAQSEAEGHVFALLCRGNMIGNASSALMRRAAVLEVGGYDTSLRARNAQGCEDYRLYLQLAERHRFALVREYLTGYRLQAASMSGDLMQMLRSFDLVLAEFSQRHPERQADFQTARNDFLRWSFERALKYGRLAEASRFAAEMLRFDPGFGLPAMLRVPAALSWRAVARPVRRAIQALSGHPHHAGQQHFAIGYVPSPP